MSACQSCDDQLAVGGVRNGTLKLCVCLGGVQVFRLKILGLTQWKAFSKRLIGAFHLNQPVERFLR